MNVTNHLYNAAIYSSLQLNTDIAFCVHRSVDICVHSEILKHMGYLFAQQYKVFQKERQKWNGIFGH